MNWQKNGIKQICMSSNNIIRKIDELYLYKKLMLECLYYIISLLDKKTILFWER